MWPDVAFVSGREQDRESPLNAHFAQDGPGHRTLLQEEGALCSQASGSVVANTLIMYTSCMSCSLKLAPATPRGLHFAGWARTLQAKPEYCS